ncbi:MAG: orotate phosphoribosyltransferase [Fidelibacterota bacterium]
MTEREIREIFQRTGAILEGHFLLTSGRHSSIYIDKFRVLQHPLYTAKLCQELAERFSGIEIDLVAGPAAGGIILAYEMARILEVRGIFCERVDGKLIFKRDFEIGPGNKVLVVEDVSTTGGSVREVIDSVRLKGAEVAGVGILVDRSEEGLDFGVKTEKLLRIKIPTCRPEDCSMCEEGIGLRVMGRTGKK